MWGIRGGQFQTAGFGISGVKIWGSATTVSVWMLLVTCVLLLKPVTLCFSSTGCYEAVNYQKQNPVAKMSGKTPLARTLGPGVACYHIKYRDKFRLTCSEIRFRYCVMS